MDNVWPTTMASESLIQIRGLSESGRALSLLGHGCSNCTSPNCCEADPAFLSKSDIERIAASTNLAISEFAEEHVLRSGHSITTLRQRPAGGCMFFRSSGNGCIIYDSRPVDCRIYPLDVKLIDGKLMWIVYTSCPDGLIDPSIDWLELVRNAEANFLASLGRDILAYAQLPTRAFDRGQWRALREVEFGHL